MKLIHVFLLVTMIVLTIFFYMSIVPCDKSKNKNNNNNDNKKSNSNDSKNNFSVTEGFDLHQDIQKVIDHRTDMLKEQTIQTTNLNKVMRGYRDDINKMRDKIEMLMETTENEGMISNTNGTLSPM